LSPRLMARVSAHVFAGAGELAPAASIRADYVLRRWHLLGGAFVARRRATPSVPVEVSPTLYASRSGFVGVEVAAGPHRLMCAFDVSQQPRGQSATLLLGVKVPLQPGR
jgi:hypothetical protein